MKRCRVKGVLLAGLLALVPELCPGADPVADRFAALDANGDQKVSWQEFHAINTNISREGFDSLDRNGDGDLSIQEWRDFSSGHGMRSSQSTLPARPAQSPLIMPPASPSVPRTPAMPPAVSEPEAPRTPHIGTPEAKKDGGSTLPLITPPHQSSGMGRAVTAPAGPRPPLITPPEVPKPASLGTGRLDRR